MAHFNTIYAADESEEIRFTNTTYGSAIKEFKLRWSIIETNLYGGYQLGSDGALASAKIEIDDGVHTPVTDEQTNTGAYAEKTFNKDISSLSGQITVKLYLKVASGEGWFKGLSLALYKA